MTIEHAADFLQALQELNIKPKNWKDLLTDEQFSRKEIIHIQDPLNLTGRNLEAFDHIQKDLRVIDDEELARQQQDPMHSLKNLSDDAKRALGKLNTEEAARVGKRFPLSSPHLFPGYSLVTFSACACTRRCMQAGLGVGLERKVELDNTKWSTSQQAVAQMLTAGYCRIS